MNETIFKREKKNQSDGKKSRENDADDIKAEMTQSRSHFSGNARAERPYEQGKKHKRKQEKQASLLIGLILQSLQFTSPLTDLVYFNKNAAISMKKRSFFKSIG